jgi:hypothetical protein
MTIQKTKANELFERIQKLMEVLFYRWSSESAYENIAEYAKALEADFKAVGATFVRMKRRPFGFTCVLENKTYQFSITSRTYTYRRIA